MKVAMKIMLGIIGTALLVLTLFGCGPSTERIGETVKTSMEEKFDSDAQFKEFHLKVISVRVLKQNDNRFQGIARVIHEETPHDLPIEITADGDYVIWKAEPGTFMFLAQKEMKKLQNLLQ